MKRRDCLKAGLTLPLLPMLLKAGPAFAAMRSRVRPGAAGWPAAAEWDRLSRAVGGISRMRSVRPSHGVD
ncbi:hypothetical protein [Stenotrophomonas sp. RG-453]|uniref:hypothetical protein n=1 Tax=Stenotrophomonas sp. RG-453 TaxID=2957502 RepID=UPI0029CA1AE3|nr:hypothetical protein [Stenotrophomonas sp. RG-453]MDX5517497.1 hypothetical protein [Stenotrophomonas sp. RG-453]